MGVGGDQSDAGQAAGDQVSEERVPRGSGLRGGDLQPQDFAVTVTVDAGRDEDDGVDHPAAFADLHRQRVSSDERERAGLVEGSMAELRDVFIFVEEDSELIIQKVGSCECIDEESYKLIGEILLDKNDITKDALERILLERKPIGQLLCEAGLVTHS